MDLVSGWFELALILTVIISLLPVVRQQPKSVGVILLRFKKGTKR